LSTTQPRRLLSIVFLTLCIGWLCSPLTAQAPAQVLPKSSARSVGQLILAIHRKAEALKGSAGMRQGFESFKLAYKLPDYAVRYDDFVVVRLLYEATRDAGFWNLHWTITDQPPNSDRVWKQWRVVDQPSPLHPTAIAECDELSALYAFLVHHAGVHGVGLFWPAANHTVAVGELHPANGSPVSRRRADESNLSRRYGFIWN